MVGSIGGVNNLVNMISRNFGSGASGSAGKGMMPPPPQGGGQDKLGVFDSVDSDSSGSISETEYELLVKGINEVSGSEFNSEFQNFDQDGDGALNGMELKSVLDEAGFKPSPPPRGEAIGSYKSQSENYGSGNTGGGEDMLVKLVDYLKNISDVDFTA